MIKIPSEFYTFGKQFWMAVHCQFPTVEETIVDTLKCMTANERKVTKEFLLNVLNGSCSTADMKRVWKSVYGKHSMNAKTTKDFFQIIWDKTTDFS